MKKKIIPILLIIASVLLLSSCDRIKGNIFMSEEKRADIRMEQIISAIKEKDRDSLKSLFSKKALAEADSIDGGMDCLFDWLQGDIVSWKREGLSSDKSIEQGKQSLMIRFSILINTNKDDFVIFVIDYNTDTINPDNEGVYMLETSKASYSGEWDFWQNRMCAGISVIE